MGKGFHQTNANEIKAQIVVKRLQPAISRQDEWAFRDGLQKCKSKYGSELVVNVLTDLMLDPWVSGVVHRMMSPNDQAHMFNESAAILAEMIEQAGLKLGFDYKVSDEGFLVSRAAWDVINATRFPKMNEIPIATLEQIAELGLPRPFKHPLAEFSEANFGNGMEPSCNLWGIVTLCINHAFGWIDDEPSPQAMKMIRQGVPKVAPTVDVDQLIWRAKYDDRYLMKLFSYMEQSFRQEFDKASEV